MNTVFIKRIRYSFPTAIKRIVDLSFSDLKEIWIALRFVANRTLFRETGQYQPIEKQYIKSYNKVRKKSKQHLLCHAPFKNLYFQMDGNVITCCNNRFYSLGKYPENSLADIWNGEKIKKLRNYIANNDLSLGCNFCYTCIKANNFRGMPTHAFDMFNSHKDYPVSLELELDNTCNLECIMCCGPLSSTVRRNRDKLPPIPKIYDDNFVESLKKIIPKLKRLKFIGGEPFLIEIYYKIWDIVLDINPECIIELQTNATILNDRIKAILNRGNFRIGVSLDSCSRGTYEIIRINAHFYSVMKNIEYFSKYSKEAGHTLSVSVCPMRINWKEIPDLINFCNDFDAIIYFNTVIYPDNLAIWSLESSEIIKIKEFYENAKLIKHSSMSLKNYERFEHFKNQINLWHEEAIKREIDKFDDNSFNEKMHEEKLFNKLQEYIVRNEDRVSRESDIEMLRIKLNYILSNIESNESKSNLITTLYNLPIELIFDLLTNDSYGMMKSIIHEHLEKSKEGIYNGYSIAYQT
jgi:MoaA/NifB/PqqE/SkfB family radical SAM enzyme